METALHAVIDKLEKSNKEVDMAITCKVLYTKEVIPTLISWVRSLEERSGKAELGGCQVTIGMKEGCP